jgi:cytochrome P450 family 6
MLHFIFLITLIVIIFFTFFILNRKHSHWKRQNIPHIAPEFFYGNARGVGVTYVHADFWKNMYLKLKSYAPLCGVYLYYEPFAIVTDLNLAKTILVKDFHIFANRGFYFNEKDDPASANLFNIEDERWKSLRNKLTPAFTSGKLKLMFPLIVEITNRMVDKLSEG